MRSRHRRFGRNFCGALQLAARGLLFLAGSLEASLSAADITLEKSVGGVTVKVDGQLFTEYLTRSGAKPVLWPLVGPLGDRLTRGYPIEPAEGEQRDHVHQRSLWFTHGKVNGIDFWSEETKEPGHGTIEHRDFVKIESTPQPLLVTRNDWMSPDGKRQCSDERRIGFGAEEGLRWIDFDIELAASYCPITFGDTKEGSFGVRVPTVMSVDAKAGGEICNSDGKRDAAAWGQRAAWVDYHGTINGQVQGIAILNHPASFRSPTWWHVRTYGLFAANPFGQHDFDGSGDGTFRLESGEKLKLCYRVILHAGDEQQAKIAEQFERYAKIAK